MNIIFRSKPYSMTHTFRYGFSSYDLVVIGGGPGGYVSAIKAA